MKQLNSGPAKIIAGIPAIKPNKITQPTSAPRIVAAAIGPAVGGIIPCATRSPANNGTPKNNNDFFVLFAKVYNIGIRITNATSRNIGTEMIKPAIPSAHDDLFTPNL